MRVLTTAFAMAAGLAIATSSAGAATIFADDFSGGVGGGWTISASSNTADAGILGQLHDETASSATRTFAAGSAQLATLSFDLLGFVSIDGFDNCCTDAFSLSLNGTTLLTGHFNLGGGGGDLITYDPNGASVVFAGLPVDPAYTGGLASISLSLALLAGSNALTFEFGNLQEFGDEAWGLDNVNVSSVPIPPALLLFGTGLAGLAGLARRKRLPSGAA